MGSAEGTENRNPGRAPNIREKTALLFSPGYAGVHRPVAMRIVLGVKMSFQLGQLKTFNLAGLRLSQ